MDDNLGIEVRNVWRHFGSVNALSGIDVHAPYGKVTALVGPNGAGKTTLLLILATLLRPDRGEVRVAGVDPAAKPDLVRARMGWMPDAFGIYDQLTVAEYLRFFADAYGLRRSDAADRVVELLGTIHLAEYARAPVHVLSRGQKQRLALARALVHRPRVLLLDEPASGLDPRSRVELRDILRGLAAEGTAVLVSSHILTELEEIADRVVLVAGGRTQGQHEMAELVRGSTTGYRVRAMDFQALVDALAARGVTPVAQSATAVELAALSEQEAAETLAALVTAGVPVISFEPIGSSLESVYLAMTEERR